MKAKKKYTEADLFFYIRKEKKLLVYITISGILYNVGMGAGPWFEGQLAQALADILQETGRQCSWFGWPSCMRW